MTDTPERIWAWRYNDPWGNELRWFEWDGHDPSPLDTEYVRADLLDAANARIAELEANKEHVKTLQAIIQWAHDTLYEINPSNYDHDDVCRLNDASVEVILGLAPMLGERHGKTPEWWTARAEALEEAARVDWVEAPYVPREWEGREAWKYVDIANSRSPRVTLDMVPRDYSRDEDHCGGVWFALFSPPAPPPIRALKGDKNENG